MSVDRDLVTRKLLLIAGDLQELRRIAGTDASGFLANRVDQVLAERYLERMIGRMIDINYHLLTESGQPPPPDYHQSFTRLADLRVLEPDFARRIARCAGLRNRLVHDYDEIDPRKIFESLVTALADIPVYLRAIERTVTGDRR